jgi:hypothetical protein|tara:strand:- start:1422 stop:1760 length:339 start_codon:yes stop_codon:yes gene_type:complete
MDPLYHSKSSVKKWGGTVDDYIKIHHWFDDSKRGCSLPTHRSMRHHTEGIGWCIDVFGKYITNSDGRQVPVRQIGEQHVVEDIGQLISMSDWLLHMSLEPWMMKVGKRPSEL